MSAPFPRCRDDLFARSRRASLSPIEQRALDAHLAVCELCRAERAFASLYDAVPESSGDGDAALVARLADRVASGASRIKRRRRSNALAVAAAVALLLVAGGAAAWVSVRGFPLRAPSREGDVRSERLLPSAPARPAPALAAVAAPSDEAIPSGVVEEMPSPSEHAIPSHRSGGARTRLAQRSVAPAPATAAALFAAANAARRALDLRRACDLYLELERRFPDSGEAPVALVSAGDLLSRLGDFGAALHAFDRYLAAHADGALAPEALFGRARSFERLGRRQDEIAAWQRLLRAFPGSVYESSGRRRLGELLQ
jgi:TolA-binding protein